MPAGCRHAAQVGKLKAVHFNVLALSPCSSLVIARHGAIHLCPKLCKQPAVCRQRCVLERRKGSGLVMSKGKGLDLGVIVHVRRIPEETSQELTGEDTKYVFVLTAKPGRI